MSRSYHCYAVTIVVAFCSLVYELLLAQTMSTLFGSSITFYSLTIGLYIFALGIGSLLAPAKGDARSTLFYLEMVLSTVGLAAPALMGWLHSVLVLQAAPPELSLLFSCSMILVIGLMSGIELPLLMRWAEESGEGKMTRVLGWDYFGSFLATVAFPFLLYPYLGLIGVAACTAGLNLAVGLSVFPAVRADARWRYATAACVLAAIVVLAYIGPQANDLILASIQRGGAG